MIEEHSMTLSGSSGTAHNLTVVAMSSKFPSNGGVYIVTVCSAEDGGAVDYNNQPIYLGKTDCLDGHFDDHPKAKCFKLCTDQLNATHDNLAVAHVICDDEKERATIHADLRDLYKYVCNGYNG